MSDIIGHVMVAILGGKAGSGRKLPIAPLIHRHWASYSGRLVPGLRYPDART